MLFLTPNPHEGENVLLESWFIGPVRRAGAVRDDFARGAASLVLWAPVFATAPSASPALGQAEAGRQEQKDDQILHGGDLHGGSRWLAVEGECGPL